MKCALRQFYQTGSNQDFETFVSEQSGWLLKVACNHLPKRISAAREIAEEVVQEALIKVKATRGQANAWTPEKGQLKGWLATMVRRACFDQARMKQTHQLPASALDRRDEGFDFLGGVEDLDWQDPLSQLIRTESQRQLRLAISHLTKPEQQLVALIYWHGLKKGEAGRRLGLSPVQVTRLLQSIHRQLGDALPPSKA